MERDNASNDEPDAVDIADFENQVETITDATDAYVVSSSDVWSTVTCMSDFDEVVALVVSLPGIVINKADRKDGKVSIMMESWANNQ